MYRLILSLLLAGNVLLATAQQRGSIEVSVLNNQKALLANATVELLKAADSVLVKAAVADANGTVVFENIAYGSYLFHVSELNHLSYYSQVFDLHSPSLKAQAIELEPRPREMSGVTVTAKKPFIQKLTDRLVVNVESSILSAGASAFEILERAPGVNIDPNDNISLRGKSGVNVMVDGKITAMSGEDLANYLRSLPSSAIDRIEIITNPSAKYDAAGNSGIIDIRLKKDQRYGTNGTFTAGYGQGVYPKANAGTNFNYRNKNINIFGSYNYAYRVGLNHLFLDRNFYSDTKQFTGKDLKDNFAKIYMKSNSARLGADYYAGKNTIIGVILNGNFNSVKVSSRNKSLVFDAQENPLNTFNTRARNDNPGNNWVGNINLKHTFDTTGRELTVDFDHGMFNRKSKSTTATSYYKLDGQPLQPDYILDGNQQGKLQITTAKADYTQRFMRDGRLDAGLKTSFIEADNDARFWDMSSGTPVNDVHKTNHFFYNENINAAYLNLQKRWGKWSVQTGLRAEATEVDTRQVNGNVKWDSSYLQFFPSAFLNYHLTDEKTLGFSASRRIDRPNYNLLNPFLFLIDVTTYSTGRPGLLPQLTWSYEVSYTVKSINFNFAYSRSTQNHNIAIVRFADAFPDIPADENVTVQVPLNLKSSDYFGVSTTIPVRIASWWNMLNNGNLFYEKFNGSLGITRLKRGRPAFQFQTSNNFSFKKGWSAELTANLNTGQQDGFLVFDPQWSLNIGAQKNILQNKGTLRFNFTDIFWTNLPKAVISYDNYKEFWNAKRETRVATISFTWRFGSNKVQQERRRSLGSDEERRRAG